MDWQKNCSFNLSTTVKHRGLDLGSLIQRCIGRQSVHGNLPGSSHELQIWIGDKQSQKFNRLLNSLRSQGPGDAADGVLQDLPVDLIAGALADDIDGYQAMDNGPIGVVFGADPVVIGIFDTH